MSDNYLQGDPDKGGVTVPFSDDESKEDAELFAEDQPGEAPEKRKERLQRRQERLQGMIQNGRHASARVKELEERDRQRERELAELRGQVAAVSVQRQPVQSQEDPFKARLDAVLQRQRDAYTAAQAEAKAGTFNEERQRHYEQVAREIEEEKGTIFAERVLAQRAPMQRAQQAQQAWINKYPEVYANQRAYEYAEGSFKRKMALLEPGKQPTNDMVDEVMQETMATFKLGSKPAPTRTERDRMSGVPASGGNGGGPSTITLTPEMRRMAVAAYDNLPEHEAIKKWTEKTGKRMREKKLA